MQNQKVAIIGAGTAGLAVASFLKKSGHDVTIFEKFESPKPLGAGLLMQPSGLSVLAMLGLDKQIIEQGSVIKKLHGKSCNQKRVILDVQYSHLSPHLFGVGTFRGNLFSALYNKVLELEVPIKAATEICDIDNNTIIDTNGNKFAGFDIVVDASGQRSGLRTKYADVKLDKIYPYGAVWSVAKLTDPYFNTEILDQRYKNAHHMIGVLPVGKIDGNTTSAAFFWSMPTKEFDKWKAGSFDDWKNYVIGLWPETRSILDQFKTHSDMTHATYRDVILRKYHNGNIAFIGDSAHCTSPQLGQGANLALVDAFVLSECINKANSVEAALTEYSRQRKAHLRFYQAASRMMTPFFQSNSWFFGKLRNILLVLGNKMAFNRRFTAQVLIGTKTGIFSTMNPRDWAKDYDLYKQ